MIVARIDSMATPPPMSADDQVKVIAAEAEATVAIIDASAEASTEVIAAEAEASTEVIDATAEAEGEGGAEPDHFRPESDHWYFKTVGRR